MSETRVMKGDAESTPQAIYLADYQVPIYLIETAELHFDLYDDHTLVRSNLRLHRNPLNKQGSNDLFLHGDELTLESVSVEEVQLSADAYQQLANGLLIKNVPDKFNLQIVTRIYPAKNTALSGLYYVQGVYCTQCEAEGFRRITYFLDRPDVLAKYTTTITADLKRFPYLLSNGNLIEKGNLPDNRHYAKWHDPFKKPCYLFALVAGDFDLLEDHFITQSKRKITLRIYLEKGYLNQAKFAMYSLKEAMAWDEKVYGREYDLDIYMIVAIGAFNMGAMENKGLNIFNTKYVLAKPETATDDDYIHILSVIGHEYFHNWSGNRVTCRDWFQLSLKEGLTIFRDQSFTEDLLSHSVMRIRDVRALREVQFPEDAGPLAHSVQPNSYIEINNFYTTTIYNKGAEVLRMLQTILGKIIFRKGMDLYFERFDGKAATIEDFIHTMETVSKLDLSQFRLWYSQAGTPTVTVEDDYDAREQIYTLTFHQTCAPTPGQTEKNPFYIPIRVGLFDKVGMALPLYLDDNMPPEEDKVLHLTKASQIFRFKNVPNRPIPSLLRHFSAPVKLNYSYADDDLLFLAKHDTDAFNRYEAVQNLALRIILRLINDVQQGNELTISETLHRLFSYLLENENDKFLLAEMLVLPSEKYIGEHLAVVDVDAIHEVREALMISLALNLREKLLSIYQRYQNNKVDDEFSMPQLINRQLKNRALSYLMLLPPCQEIGLQQFKQFLSINMSETQSAFASIVNLDIPEREEAINQFYQTWQHEQLVVDKWFALQALSKLPNTLNQVRKLLRHKAFDIKNPNKVYALIGSFSRHNPINFHDKSGEGYAFLRETVHELDKINPQVAARMIIPLTEWHRYDKDRQGLMREQLKLLLQDKKLSTDLYELVSKSLNKAES